MMKLKLLSMACCLTTMLAFGCGKENSKQDDELSDYTVSKNVVYGNALTNRGRQQSLEMDVYQPDNGRTANPLLVVMHSGGFYTGTRDELAEFCAFFAQRNFTTVTVSYRLGWNMGTGTDFCGGDAYSVIQAGYRATQDLNASLRYLVANAAQYKIDTSRIFIGGASAGSVAAMIAAFVKPAEFRQYFPNLESELGSLSGSGNNLTQTFQVKGVLNMWGGVLSPSVIESTDRIPVISFHGGKDPVVPYDQGNFAGCTTYPGFFGSKQVYTRLTSLGVPAVLHTDENGGHGVYDLKYLAQNSYCFLTQIMNGEKPTGTFTNTVSNCR